MKRLLLSTVLALTLLLPASAAASNFGRLFPNLPAFTAPTVNELNDLSQADQDANQPPENLQEPSGMTYLGQFADHDLTLDTLPQPTFTVDPTTLLNNRTFAFDLDSVFGNGPNGSPQLYTADGHLRIQNPNANGVTDLPRNPDGSAIIADDRNDENQIIGQIQVAFIAFYNRLIDQGQSPAQARQTEQNYWQWVVLTELLPTFIGQDRVNSILSQRGNSDNYRLSTPLFPTNTFTPVEFSVAAYRLHTIVRLAYVVNDRLPITKTQVFNAAGNDLHGGRQLGPDHEIDWGNFLVKLAGSPPIVNGAPAADFNFGRPFDHFLSKSLFNLPIPGAEPSGSNNLAFRNLIRGHFYSFPSGQSVASALGVTPIPASTINPTSDVVFNTATPLWQYINAEEEVLEGGHRMGPVGAAIVGQTFLRVLATTPGGILRQDGNSANYRLAFKPAPQFSAPCSTPGTFSFADFVVFAGQATCP